MGQNIAVWIKLFNLKPLVTKKKDIIINTCEWELQLCVSRGTFPEVLITDKKGRGREESEMDSSNTFKAQLSQSEDSEVLSLSSS